MISREKLEDIAQRVKITAEVILTLIKEEKEKGKDRTIDLNKEIYDLLCIAADELIEPIKPIKKGGE